MFCNNARYLNFLQVYVEVDIITYFFIYKISCTCFKFHSLFTL